VSFTFLRAEVKKKEPKLQFFLKEAYGVYCFDKKKMFQRTEVFENERYLF